MKSTFNKLGFWAAILSAAFAVLWFVTFNMQDLLASVPDWRNLDAYAESFRMVRLLLIYPSLLLALTYVVLLVCVHGYAAEDKKVWSLTALSIGILYAAMASVNYNIQASAVRQSLAAGEIAGIEMWIPDNPHSVFEALSNSYGYMAVSMFFAGFVFRGGGLQRWIRIVLFAQAITAIGQFGWTMFDLNTGVFIATSLVWVIGAPIAFILLAILFRREERVKPSY